MLSRLCQGRASHVDAKITRERSSFDRNPGNETFTRRGGTLPVLYIAMDLDLDRGSVYVLPNKVAKRAMVAEEVIQAINVFYCKYSNFPFSLCGRSFR